MTFPGLKLGAEPQKSDTRVLGLHGNQRQNGDALSRKDFFVHIPAESRCFGQLQDGIQPISCNLKQGNDSNA